MNQDYETNRKEFAMPGYKMSQSKTNVSVDRLLKSSLCHILIDQAVQHFASEDRIVPVTEAYEWVLAQDTVWAAEWKRRAVEIPNKYSIEFFGAKAAVFEPNYPESNDELQVIRENAEFDDAE